MKYVRELRERGGIIGISGHLGAWELAGAATGAEGYPILAKRYSDPVEQEVVAGIRTRLGIRPIYQDQSLMRVIRLLRMVRWCRCWSTLTFVQWMGSTFPCWVRMPIPLLLRQGWRSRPVQFCSLLFGQGCRKHLSF